MKTKSLFLLLLTLFFFIQETEAQMSGTYAIGWGAGDDYQTLFQALQDLQIMGADDPVVFELSADYNPAMEAYPIIIQPFSGASELNTLTIRPANGTTHVIETATASTLSAVFTLLDASHIIIDGSNNGTNTRDLTIINTAEINQTAPVALFTNSSPGTNIIVKNCILKAHSNTYETAGIFSDQFTDVVIENNEIMQTSIGVICAGHDILISNNIIGSDIQSEYVRTSVGINFGSNIEISNNICKNLIATLDNNVLMGSYLMNITGTCVFENNRIDSVINIGTGTAIGLFIKDCLPAQMDIVNNHISHVASDNYSDQMPMAIAIDCPGMTSGLNILYNTISMDEDNTNGIGSGVDNGISAGILFHQGGGINMKNNIIMNSLGERDGSVYSTSGYALVCSAAASPFAELNNNVYFSNGDNDYTFLALTNGSPVNLADWQTWTGDDANSFYEDPLFTSSDDLHLQACSPSVAHAVDIPEITTDIELNTRDTEYPTMGAYEYEKVQATYVILFPPYKGFGILGWTQGSGCKSIVFVKQGNVLPETPIPVNGTTYVADINFGDGDQIGTSGWYCVYNDYNIGGEVIGPDGEYTVMVCEYFGDAGNEIYLTESAVDNPNVGFLSDIYEINSQYINIHPNPTTGKVMVEIDRQLISNNKIKEIKIIDITGKEIIQINNISQQKFEIDLSDLGRGIYLIKVKSEEGIYTEKLILE